MPNIALVLKDEIRRLARKEVKLQVAKTRKAAAQYRRDLIHLRQMVKSQEQMIKRLSSQRADAAAPAAEEEADPLAGARFSARSVRSQRRRLKLSAEQFGKLIGVSPQTIYHWEQGKSRPRRAQMAALVTVREMGRRQALAQLEEME